MKKILSALHHFALSHSFAQRSTLHALLGLGISLLAPATFAQTWQTVDDFPYLGQGAYNAGLTIAPNGNVLTVNGGDGFLVETTPAGKQIDFFVRRFRGDCTAGRGKTFQLAGVKVYWNHTPSEQMAWRCVGGVRMMAVTSLPPNRFADVGLGRMAASGHRIPR